MLIIHLADIHIRQSRVEEITKVVDIMIDELELIDEKMLVVVAGDVFDNKIRLLPEEIICFNDFVRKIRAIKNVVALIIIPGNHDGMVIKENIDLISPLAEMHENTVNFYYYKKSGSYQPHGIAVAGLPLNVIVLSPLDDFKVFDRPKQGYFNLVIGHFTLNATVLQNNSISSGGKFSAEMFRSYDLTLLGDNHKRQYGKGNIKWGYPSSLIQQNIGEPPYEHGYLIWKVEKLKNNNINNEGKECKEDSIYSITCHERDLTNPFGVYVKIVMKNNKCLTTLRSNVKIRRCVIEYTDCDNDTIVAVQQQLIKTFGCPIERTTNMKEYEQITQVQQKITKIEELFTNWLDYNKILDIYRPGLWAKFKHYQKETMMTRSKFNIKYIEWQNLLCYEKEVNWIDFSKDVSGGLISISGENRCGKSSIVDVILLCLWGISIKTTNINLLVNKNAETWYCRAIVEIVSPDAYTIEIKRAGTTGINKHKSLSIYKNNVNIVSTDQKIQPQKWLDERIGTANSFITMNLYSQAYPTINFIEMKESDRIKFVMSMLGCDHIATVIKEISSANSELNGKIMTMYEVAKTKCMHQPSQIELADLKTRLTAYTQAIQEKTAEIKKFECGGGGASDGTIVAPPAKHIEKPEEILEICAIERARLSQQPDITFSAVEIQEFLRCKDYAAMIKTLENNIQKIGTNIIDEKEVMVRQQELCARQQDIDEKIAEEKKRLEIFKGKIESSVRAVFVFSESCVLCQKNKENMTLLYKSLTTDQIELMRKHLEDYIAIKASINADIINLNKQLDWIKIKYKNEAYLLEIDNLHKEQERKIQYIKHEIKVRELREISEKETLAKQQIAYNKSLMYKKRDECFARLAILNEEKNKIETAIKLWENKETIFQKELIEWKEMKAKINEMETEHEINRIYINAMNLTTGIPNALVKIIVAQMTELLNVKLNEIQAGFDIKTTPANDSEILAAGCPLVLCSGYQKFVINILMQSVLRELISNTCDKPITDFTIIDEGFGSCSPKNLEQICENLAKIVRSGILISHIHITNNFTQLQLTKQPNTVRCGKQLISDERKTATTINTTVDPFIKTDTSSGWFCTFCQKNIRSKQQHITTASHQKACDEWH